VCPAVAPVFGCCSCGAAAAAAAARTAAAVQPNGVYPW
jgi:hypothetical protein